MRPLVAALSIAVLGTAACNPAPTASAAPVTAAATSAVAAPIAAAAHTPAAPGRKLLFFVNPNGRPCQMQDQILREMPDLRGLAEVVYLSASEPSDFPAYQAFGVRSLPMLVLVDASGRELRRGTPGIQSADAVRALLAP
jgi:thioredoxin 1